jgi:geranylgeranyl diphosphate synthase type II
MGKHRQTLLVFHKEVNNEIQNYLRSISNSPLYPPIAYALSTKGKRLRPILTKMMAQALGKGYDVNRCALAIELFHTASLIADDLPCMDNDDFRREQPSLHKKFNEATALLSSYCLLTEGFSEIEKSGVVYHQRGYGTEIDGQKRVCLALKETARLSGPKGAALGQYFDIEQKKTQSLEEFEELYYLKTGTLFQGAFTLGYIFGGGDLKNLSLIEKLSFHLGFAFQIRDDLEDMGEKQMSFSKRFGEQESKRRCDSELKDFFITLEQLDVDKALFIELVEFVFPK